MQKTKGKTKTVKMGIHGGNSISTLQQLKKLKALDRLAVRSTTTITKATPQASVEIMIDLRKFKRGHQTSKAL